MNGRKRPVYVFAVLGAVIVTGSLAYELSNVRKGYEPRQPILFRHTRMAGPPENIWRQISRTCAWPANWYPRSTDQPRTRERKWCTASQARRSGRRESGCR